jgi:Putative Ig domain
MMKRTLVAAIVAAGSLLMAGLGTAAPALAATAAPALVTSSFVCSNGICEVGPGNVGQPFAAGLSGTGGPTYYGPECSPYTMAVTSGSLPPGLQFGAPDCEYIVSGTPAKAGTYSFTVQITPQPNNLGQIPGPSGTQKLTITIGTGSSDRLANVAAGFNGHLFHVSVSGYDVNTSALYSVSVTSTGKVIIPAQTAVNTDGHWQLTSAHLSQDPCAGACSVTVTDSLGSSVTVTMPPATY